MQRHFYSQMAINEADTFTLFSFENRYVHRNIRCCKWFYTSMFINCQHSLVTQYPSVAASVANPGPIRGGADLPTPSHTRAPTTTCALPPTNTCPKAPSLGAQVPAEPQHSSASTHKDSLSCLCRSSFLLLIQVICVSALFF